MRFFSKTKRAISLFTLFFFVCNAGVGYAGSIESVSSISQLAARNTKQQAASYEPLAALPKELGTVEQVFDGKSKFPILHIQDAHSNYDAQNSIAGLIEYIESLRGAERRSNPIDKIASPSARNDRTLVLMEGVFGEIDTTLLQAIPDANLKSNGVERLLKKGLISGPEYFQVTSPMSEKVTIRGIEEKNSYRKNYEAFLAVQNIQPKIDREVKLIETYLGNIQNKIYPKKLREFDRYRLRFQSGTMDLSLYLQKILSFAKGAIDWVSFPQLRELTQLIQKKNISAKEVAELKARLDANQVFRELHQLERQIRKSYLISQPQKELDSYLSQFRLFKNGLNLELIPEEVNELRIKENQLNVPVLQKFVKEQLGNKDWPDHSLVASALERIFDFYHWAEERDKYLHQNILKQIRQAGDQSVIVVTGGYHSRGLSDLFRKDELSFAVIAPTIQRVQAEETHELYLQNMREWKFLANTTAVLKAFDLGDENGQLLSLEARADGAAKRAQEVYRRSLAADDLKTLRENYLQQIEGKSDREEKMRFWSLVESQLRPAGEKLETIAQEGSLGQSLGTLQELEQKKADLLSQIKDPQMVFDFYNDHKESVKFLEILQESLREGDLATEKFIADFNQFQPDYKRIFDPSEISVGENYSAFIDHLEKIPLGFFTQLWQVIGMLQLAAEQEKMDYPLPKALDTLAPSSWINLMARLDSVNVQIAKVRALSSGASLGAKGVPSEDASTSVEGRPDAEYRLFVDRRRAVLFDILDHQKEKITRNRLYELLMELSERPGYSEYKGVTPEVVTQDTKRDPDLRTHDNLEVEERRSYSHSSVKDRQEAERAILDAQTTKITRATLLTLMKEKGFQNIDLNTIRNDTRKMRHDKLEIRPWVSKSAGASLGERKLSQGETVTKAGPSLIQKLFRSALLAVMPFLFAFATYEIVRTPDTFQTLEQYASQDSLDPDVFRVLAYLDDSRVVPLLKKNVEKLEASEPQDDILRYEIEKILLKKGEFNFVLGDQKRLVSFVRSVRDDGPARILELPKQIGLGQAPLIFDHAVFRKLLKDPDPQLHLFTSVLGAQLGVPEAKTALKELFMKYVKSPGREANEVLFGIDSETVLLNQAVVEHLDDSEIENWFMKQFMAELNDSKIPNSVVTWRDWFQKHSNRQVTESVMILRFLAPSDKMRSLDKDADLLAVSDPAVLNPFFEDLMKVYMKFDRRAKLIGEKIFPKHFQDRREEIVKRLLERIGKETNPTILFDLTQHLGGFNSKEADKVMIDRSQDIALSDEARGAAFYYLLNAQKPEAAQIFHQIWQMKPGSEFYERIYDRYVSTKDGDFKKAFALTIVQIYSEGKHEEYDASGKIFFAALLFDAGLHREASVLIKPLLDKAITLKELIITKLLINTPLPTTGAAVAGSGIVGETMVRKFHWEFVQESKRDLPSSAFQLANLLEDSPGLRAELNKWDPFGFQGRLYSAYATVKPFKDSIGHLKNISSPEAANLLLLGFSIFFWWPMIMALPYAFLKELRYWSKKKFSRDAIRSSSYVLASHLSVPADKRLATFLMSGGLTLGALIGTQSIGIAAFAGFVGTWFPMFSYRRNFQDTLRSRIESDLKSGRAPPQYLRERWEYELGRKIEGKSLGTSPPVVSAVELLSEGEKAAEISAGDVSSYIAQKDRRQPRERISLKRQWNLPALVFNLLLWAVYTTNPAQIVSHTMKKLQFGSEIEIQKKIQRQILQQKLSWRDLGLLSRSLLSDLLRTFFLSPLIFLRSLAVYLFNINNYIINNNQNVERVLQLENKSNWKVLRDELAAHLQWFEIDRATSETERAAMEEAFRGPKKSDRINAITQDRKELQIAWREIQRASLGQGKEQDELITQAMKAALDRKIAAKVATASGQSLGQELNGDLSEKAIKISGEKFFSSYDRTASLQSQLRKLWLTLSRLLAFTSPLPFSAATSTRPVQIVSQQSEGNQFEDRQEMQLRIQKLLGLLTEFWNNPSRFFQIDRGDLSQTYRFTSPVNFIGSLTVNLLLINNNLINIYNIKGASLGQSPLDKKVELTFGERKQTFSLNRIRDILEVSGPQYGIGYFEKLTPEDQATITNALTPDARLRLEIDNFISANLRDALKVGGAGANLEVYERVNKEALAGFQNEIFRRGLYAHGVAADKGSLESLLAILLEGKIRSGQKGPLDDSPNPQISAGPHGPFYVVLTDPSRVDWAERGNQALYLVPESSDRNVLIYVLQKAVRSQPQLISRELEREIESKIVTYEEYAKRPSQQITGASLGAKDEIIMDEARRIRLSDATLRDNERLKELGFGQVGGPLRKNMPEYKAWLTQALKDYLKRPDPSLLPLSHLLIQDSSKAIETFTNSLIRMKEGSIRRLERDGFLPKINTFDAMRLNTRDVNIQLLNQSLIRLLKKYDAEKVPAKTQLKFLSKLVPYEYIEDLVVKYDIERGLAQTAAVRNTSNPDAFLDKVLTNVPRLMEKYDIERGLAQTAAVGYPSDPDAFLDKVLAHVPRLMEKYSIERSLAQTAAVSNFSNPDAFLDKVLADVPRLMKKYSIERSLSQTAAAGYPSDPDAFLDKVLANVPRLMEKYDIERGLAQHAAVSNTSSPDAFLDKVLADIPRLMEEYSIERGLAQRAAVNYPSDPDAFLDKVLADIPRLMEKYDIERGLAQRAAVSNTSSPDAFLDQVLADAPRLMKKYDIEHGLAQTAAVSNTSNPDTFLDKVLADIPRLMAKYDIERSLAQRAAVSNTSNPDASLDVAKQKVPELMTKHKTSASHAWRAAIEYPNNPDAYFQGASLGKYFPPDFISRHKSIGGKTELPGPEGENTSYYKIESAVVPIDRYGFSVAMDLHLKVIETFRPSDKSPTNITLPRYMLEVYGKDPTTKAVKWVLLPEIPVDENQPLLIYRGLRPAQIDPDDMDLEPQPVGQEARILVSWKENGFKDRTLYLPRDLYSAAVSRAYWKDQLERGTRKKARRGIHVATEDKFNDYNQPGHVEVTLLRDNALEISDLGSSNGTQIHELKKPPVSKSRPDVSSLEISSIKGAPSIFMSPENAGASKMLSKILSSDQEMILLPEQKFSFEADKPFTVWANVAGQSSAQNHFEVKSKALYLIDPNGERTLLKGGKFSGEELPVSGQSFVSRINMSRAKAYEVFLYPEENIVSVRNYSAGKVTVRLRTEGAQGASLGDGKPYKINLSKEGDYQWKVVRAEENGQPASFLFETKEVTPELSDPLTDQVAALYRLVASELDTAQAKEELFEGGVQKGHEPIMLLSNQEVVGFYQFARHSKYLLQISVREDYRGTGAIDVLLEDLVDRFLKGNRDAKFIAHVTRQSAKAQKGSFRGTVDEFKKRLGVQSVVTSPKSAVGASLGEVDGSTPNREESAGLTAITQALYEVMKPIYPQTTLESVRLAADILWKRFDLAASDIQSYQSADFAKGQYRSPNNFKEWLVFLAVRQHDGILQNVAALSDAQIGDLILAQVSLFDQHRVYQQNKELFRSFPNDIVDTDEFYSFIATYYQWNPKEIKKIVSFINEKAMPLLPTSAKPAVGQRLSNVDKALAQLPVKDFQWFDFNDYWMVEMLGEEEGYELFSKGPIVKKVVNKFKMHHEFKPFFVAELEREFVKQKLFEAEKKLYREKPRQHGEAAYMLLDFILNQDLEANPTTPLDPLRIMDLLTEYEELIQSHGDSLWLFTDSPLYHRSNAHLLSLSNFLEHWVKGDETESKSGAHLRTVLVAREVFENVTTAAASLGDLDDVLKELPVFQMTSKDFISYWQAEIAPTGKRRSLSPYARRIQAAVSRFNIPPDELRSFVATLERAFFQKKILMYESELERSMGKLDEEKHAAFRLLDAAFHLELEGNSHDLLDPKRITVKGKKYDELNPPILVQYRNLIRAYGDDLWKAKSPPLLRENRRMKQLDDSIGRLKSYRISRAETHLRVISIAEGYLPKIMGSSLGRDESRAEVVKWGQQYLDIISEGDDVETTLPDAYLVLGNSDLNSFLRFAEAWKKIRQEKKIEIPIVLAGGWGRGTAPLILAVKEYYAQKGTLLSADERWLGEGLANKNITESQILKLVFKNEGIPEAAMHFEKEPSKNTAANFANSKDVIIKLLGNISNPTVALVTSPPLLMRVQATARNSWIDQTISGWQIKRFKAYKPKTEGLTDDQLIEFFGYVVGYPEKYRKLYSALNGGNELRGSYKKYNPSVISVSLSKVKRNQAWTSLLQTQQAFEKLLDSYSDAGELVYDPIKVRLRVQVGASAQSLGSIDEFLKGFDGALNRGDFRVVKEMANEMGDLPALRNLKGTEFAQMLGSLEKAFNQIQIQIAKQSDQDKMVAQIAIARAMVFLKSFQGELFANFEKSGKEWLPQKRDDKLVLYQSLALPRYEEIKSLTPYLAETLPGVLAGQYAQSPQTLLDALEVMKIKSVQATNDLHALPKLESGEYGRLMDLGDVLLIPRLVVDKDALARNVAVAKLIVEYFPITAYKGAATVKQLETYRGILQAAYDQIKSQSLSQVNAPPGKPSTGKSLGSGTTLGGSTQLTTGGVEGPSKADVLYREVEKYFVGIGGVNLDSIAVFLEGQRIAFTFTRRKTPDGKNQVSDDVVDSKNRIMIQLEDGSSLEFFNELPRGLLNPKSVSSSKKILAAQITYSFEGEKVETKKILRKGASVQPFDPSTGSGQAPAKGKSLGQSVPSEDASASQKRKQRTPTEIASNRAALKTLLDQGPYTARELSEKTGFPLLVVRSDLHLAPELKDHPNKTVEERKLRSAEKITADRLALKTLLDQGPHTPSELSEKTGIPLMIVWRDLILTSELKDHPNKTVEEYERRSVEKIIADRLALKTLLDQGPHTPSELSEKTGIPLKIVWRDLTLAPELKDHPNKTRRLHRNFLLEMGLTAQWAEFGDKSVRVAGRPSKSPDEELADKEMSIMVQAGVRSLPERQREIANQLLDALDEKPEAFDPQSLAQLTGVPLLEIEETLTQLKEILQKTSPSLESESRGKSLGAELYKDFINQKVVSGDKQFSVTVINANLLKQEAVLNGLIDRLNANPGEIIQAMWHGDELTEADINKINLKIKSQIASNPDRLKIVDMRSKINSQNGMQGMLEGRAMSELLSLAKKLNTDANVRTEQDVMPYMAVVADRNTIKNMTKQHVKVVEFPEAQLPADKDLRQMAELKMIVLAGHLAALKGDLEVLAKIFPDVFKKKGDLFEFTDVLLAKLAELSQSFRAAHRAAIAA